MPSRSLIARTAIRTTWGSALMMASNQKSKNISKNIKAKVEIYYFFKFFNER